MRSYRRAALLAGFISVCEAGGGDARASLPTVLRAEAATFAQAVAAALAARSSAAAARTEEVSRESAWDGLLEGYAG
jgi:hypothetical protein